MLSRRSFLAASLGLLFAPEQALAAPKKKKPVEIKKFGPRTLSREQWPPAISPDFVSIVEKGYAMLSDQSGRLAIVDLKREQGPAVIGELLGIGKKTVDMAVVQHRAYALAYQEAGSDAQHYLVTMSVTPAHDPTVLSRIPLSYLSEPVTIAASADAVAIGGVGAKGENQVLVFGISTKRRPEEGTLPSATITFEQPVTQVDLQERQLSVLQAGPRVTTLDVFNLFSPRNPERVGGFRLEGHYPFMARTRELIVLGGQGADRKFELLSVAPRPTPKVVARLQLPASEILDIAAQRGQLLVLANQINRQVVIPVSYNAKTLALTAGQAAVLPAGTRGAASKARIAVAGKDAYVASDWGGVQVLNISGGGWKYLYSHTIPRLPAAAIAAAGNRAVLGGADLKLYDITTPEQPTLVSATELDGTVRAVAAFDKILLALTRNTLSMRNLDRPGDVIASVKVNGQTFSYDPVGRRVYVLAATDKQTTITPVFVSQSLIAGKPQQIQGSFNHAAAYNGNLLVAGLNSLALYSVAEDQPKLVGTRNFPNLALRAVRLNGDVAVATAVDSNSKGYLLTINSLKEDLPTIGSIDVPQDAVALAVAGRSAVVVGRGQEGQDVASLIDLSSVVAPKLLQSFPVVEAASAVAIRDKIALVVGRGLEILSLA
jgi:hypothetical protein